MKKMHRLYRIGAMAVAILLPLGVVLATGTTEASAATTWQYCEYTTLPAACLNAWGGGPYVNVEETKGLQNNNFDVVSTTNGYYQIQFVGGGQYHNDCIGDEGNVPGNADAGLVVCNTIAGGAGWGTLFTLACGGADPGFYNAHWGGYLGPAGGYVNGSHFYLNKPKSSGPYCFDEVPPGP